MIKKTLDSYIKEKESEAKEILDYAEKLKKINLSLKIQEDEDSIQLFSNDYSLATKVKIDYNVTDKGGYTSEYDGGYYTYLYEYYPVFSFDINFLGEQKEVLLESKRNKSFFTINKTEATGDYRDKNQIHSVVREEEKVLDFYKKKKVPENLLDNLKNQMALLRSF